MDSLGRRDPQGYYIVVIPKTNTKVLEELKDRVEVIDVSNDRILIRSKSRRIILEILRRPRDYLQELVEDFVEIATSFAARIYGKRSSRYKQVVKCIGETVKDFD